MKKYRILACLLALAMVFALLAGCGNKTDDASEPTAAPNPTATPAADNNSDVADMVLTNGNIITMVSEGDTAEAVAVKNGEIVYVGDATGAEAFVADSTEVIDLDGKTVLPGFIDGHTHTIQNIIQKNSIVYLNETPADLEEYKKALTDFVEAHPDAEIIHGSGIDLNAFPESIPTCDWIDEICPDIPVVFTDMSLHGRLLNTKAMEICEITKDTQPTTNGNILKDANGELTGFFSDCNLFGNLPALEKTEEMFVEAYKEYQAEANSYGITGVDFGGNEMNPDNEWHAIDSMYKDGSLTTRISAAAFASKPINTAEAERMIGIFNDGQKYASDFLKINQVKVSMDGVPEAKTSSLLEPYAPEAGEAPDYTGPEVTPQQDMTDFVTAVNAAGYQVNIHAMGDNSVRVGVNAMEYSQEQNGEKDYRNIVTHLNLVKDEDAKRMGELGIYAAMQPIWWYYDPMFSPLEEQMFGTERFNTEYHIADLVNYGIKITGSTDYPITLDYAPLVGIEVGATQCSPYAEQQDSEDYLRNADQAVPVYEMLKMYTIYGAEQMYMDDLIGTIEVGKKADLVVLGDNPLNCDVKAISDIQVVYTISDGRIVYEG